ncbi:2-succinyl-6-hydroxy-2,4-cyclohexadiene-1-carboxylate synthase, partial [Yersinia pestis PY-64]
MPKTGPSSGIAPPS